MATSPFNILSLCSGVGMLDEGVCLAVPGARTVCYVERESGAAAILLARMGDKALEPAPVWCGNLEDFDIKPWALALDCITAGFPCQPHSQAGARKSTEDERWIWPAIADLVRRIIKARDAAGEVRPFYLFLENVRGLLTSGDGGALAQVLADLALMGFDAEWGLLSAASVGASHQRERIFILGRRSLDSSSERGLLDGGADQHPADAGIEALGESEPRSRVLANAKRQRRQHGSQFQERVKTGNRRTRLAGSRTGMAHPICARSQERTGGGAATMKHFNRPAGPTLSAFIEHSPQAQQIQAGETSSPSATGSPRRLNPAFTCWLMGWPWWWTNPAQISFAQQEMESYRSRQRQLLESLTEDLRDKTA